jgi:hypothetical protein
MFHLRSLRVTVIASLADAGARAKATTTFARRAGVLRGDPVCRDAGPADAFLDAGGHAQRSGPGI